MGLQQSLTRDIPATPITQGTSLVNASLAQSIASRQVLRYASYCWDAESGLYYCSARYYDPVTRQWLSKDPEKADGEESSYQYCAGDPIGSVDATGEGKIKLDVIGVKQNYGTGCGIACARSTIKYYWPSRNFTERPDKGSTSAGKKHPTQKNIKDYVGVPVGNDDGGYTGYNCCDALGGWDTGANYKWDPFCRYWSNIAEEIRDRQPVFVGGTTPFHWWLACGSKQNSDGKNCLRLMNPGTGIIRWYVWGNWKKRNNPTDGVITYAPDYD